MTRLRQVARPMLVYLSALGLGKIKVSDLYTLKNNNFFFIIWQLGTVLNKRTPPITTGMHRDSRISLHAG